MRVIISTVSDRGTHPLLYRRFTHPVAAVNIAQADDCEMEYRELAAKAGVVVKVERSFG